MSINQRNFGIAEGRLTRDPKVFTNKDGSRKVAITLAVRRNYKSANGSTESDFINLEGFLTANIEDLGVYKYMHTGDLIGVEYSVRSNRFTDKDGVERFEQTLFVQGIDLKETKNVTDARHNTQASAPAQETVPAPAPTATSDDTPFND